MKLDIHIPDPYECRFKLSVRVTADGMFTTTLPPEMAQLWEGSGLELHRNRSKRLGYFYSETLRELRDNVDSAVQELCSREEVGREKVLRYSVDTACAYAVDPDGGFLPNGYGSVDGWHDGTLARHSNSQGPFGLWLYVEPLIKVTSRYTATQKEIVEYSGLPDRGLGEDVRNDDIKWLDNLVAISPSDRYGGETLTVREMPCTPEAAKMFRSLLESLFAMNERLKPFLTEEGMLQLAEAGPRKLL